ncbi:MAG TPA: hypothetical protein PLO56_16150 [Rhodothermales bacterium]|nr:hypothetical protein [Rhodothermales bacterium]
MSFSITSGTTCNDIFAEVIQNKPLPSGFGLNFAGSFWYKGSLQSLCYDTILFRIHQGTEAVIFL